MNPEQIAEIEERAAYITEYGGATADEERLADVDVPALVAEVKRRTAERDEALKEMREARAELDRVRDMHGRPRTDRHGSGCIHCAIVWPCPTYLAAGGVRP